VIISLALIGTVGVCQTPVVEDDFTDPAGNMPSPGTAPNDNPAWRWNEAVGTFNMYDGTTTLSMPLEPSGGYNQHIDLNHGLAPGGSYALVFVYNMPVNAEGGDQQFGFAGNPDWDTAGGNQRVFYLSGPTIIWTDWAEGPVGGLHTMIVGSQVPATVQSLMIRIDDTGAITIWYFDGALKDPLDPSWVELTTRTCATGDCDPSWFTMPSGPNTIGVNHFYAVPDRTGHFFGLDYIGLWALNAEALSVTDWELYTTN
jgi:hypothetical protein